MSITERTSLLIGARGVERLASSFVVVAGAGAVGGYVIEGLVRAGVGRIRVVDGDVFDETNMNRQLLATRNTIGLSKAQVAVERALSINPDIEVEAVNCLISSDNARNILSGNPDALVDAIDTVEHKSMLLRTAIGLGIPCFSSMGAALKTETQSIKVAPLKRTKVCPLAATVRSKLRDLDTGSVLCVYSEELPVVKPDSRDAHGKSVLGSLPTIPAVFGMTLANEVIKHLLK